MTTTQQRQTTTTHTFEVPFEIRRSTVAAAMAAAKQDAHECASLNPGSTVKWIWHSSFYWHGAYIVTVPVA